MGQSVSQGSTSNISSENDAVNEKVSLFYQHPDEILPRLPNLVFEQNMKQFKEASNVKFEELIPILGLDPALDPRVCAIMNNIFSRLSQFAMVNKQTSLVDYHSFKMACLILAFPNLCGKLLSTHNQDYVKLLFMSLVPIDPDHENEKSSTPFSEKSGTVSTTQSIDELALPSVSASIILLFLTFITSISHFCLLKCKISPTYMHDHWVRYQRGPAFNILRTINPNITSQNISKESVTLEQFRFALQDEFPKLLTSLNLLFHAFFELKHTSLPPAVTLQESTLFNLELRSQLATFMSSDFVYANIIKLYSGKDVGFSMRAIQAKVLKWNAPTLMIIKGQLLSDEDKNPRYRKFITEEYPKLRGSHQGGDKEVVTYVVYIDEPWKVTNKNLFANGNTQIIEIQPTQTVHKATGSGSLGNVYFNVMGGGIGVGNSLQPTIKNSDKKYHPGNVSLTIDSGLEFGCFRNVGYGGLFDPGSSYSSGNEQERRFIIQGMEIWGCGGEEVLKEQLEAWQWDENESKRRQKINLKSVGEDRALLEMAGLVGQNQSGGSM
ncbi:hypothetical protein ACO0RG_004069 [Hanseniaspora osmophila]